MCKSDLSVPLVQPQPRRGKASVAGLLMVTSAALLFGVVAAFVKAAALPTLVMLQIRSLLEWMLGVTVALSYYINLQRMRGMFAAPSTAELMEGGAPSASTEDGSLLHLLAGPPHLWHWLMLRAFLYWGFLACWWLSLSSMPIGDATTIVYTAPIWTATFAFFLLGERIDWTFYPILLLDVSGVILITQPSFIFGNVVHAVPEGTTSNATAGGRTTEDSYLLGTLCALSSAFIAGLLPVCTRKSKEAYWISVNQVSDALSAFVFTPLAFVVWFTVDPTAADQSHAAAAALFASGGSGGAGKWTLLLGATLTGFAGLALQTLGYQREEAAKASVMTILEIPFAYLLQNIVFHDEITPLGLGGVGLVICGTTLNLLRHLQRATSEKQQVKAG